MRTTETTPVRPRPSRVFVTGLGAVSALGTGLEAHRQALREGRDGLAPVERFDTSAFNGAMAGLWPAWKGKTQDDLDFASLADLEGRFSTVEMAVTAAREALADAGWEVSALRGPGAPRVAVVLGSCFGQGFSGFHAVSEAVAARMALDAFTVMISTACSSSTNAVGLGRDLLLQGQADLVLAGGVDLFLREVLAGFNALRVVSREKCAPFGVPYGINLGEGAGVVVLEREDADEKTATMSTARKGRARAVIEGYGLSADAFHETTPDPSGRGLERALRWALRDARISASTISYVNAHATGTESNDRIEWQALARVLRPGTNVSPLPVMGLKSFLGHAQGAAGVLELILALLAQEDGTLPPTLRSATPRPGAPPDPVASERPRPAARGRAVKISAGFGGANAVLVYGPAAPATLPDEADEADEADDRDDQVVVHGLGAVSPLGLGFEPLAAALEEGNAIEGRVPRFDLAAVLPTADPRALDPPALFLTAAAALAFGREGSRAAFASHDIGLFVGATRMAQQSSRRCRASLEAHGPAGMSAAAFARMSVNAPTGACSKALELRGPTSTLSIGPGSGLAAFAYAAAWLNRRRDTRGLLAAGLDEERPFEGALAVHLGRVPRGTPGIAVAGWGWARHGEAARAARTALGEAALPDGVLADHESARAALTPHVSDAASLPFGFYDVSTRVASGEACRALLALAVAVRALQRGRATSLLVIAAEGPSATVAVHLQRRLS